MSMSGTDLPTAECPFCGAPHIRLEFQYCYEGDEKEASEGYVRCMTCEASGPIVQAPFNEDIVSMAYAKWNARSPASPLLRAAHGLLENGL